MTSTRVLNQAGASLALTLILLAGCNAIVGLDKIEVSDLAESAGRSTGGAGGSMAGASGALSNGGKGDAGGPVEPADECTTNRECTDLLLKSGVGEGGAGPDGNAAVCVKKPYAHCVPLLSAECGSVVGDYLDDQAIVIGSLFQTSGSTALTNVQRQQAAWLGVEQINASGGIPGGSTSANPRPLVMVSCDATNKVLAAAGHLVNELQVPAIVGPNTSQDTLDVSTKVSVPGGTVLMSPSGVASSIASLTDNDLTWLMVPSDVQRAPLMLSQLNELETALRAERAAKPIIKLGIVFRDDALGRGTRTALDELILNGKSMAHPTNLNNAVQIDAYVGSDPDQKAIVTKYLGFLPDIIVLAGTAEVITNVMVPLEADWPASAPRPSYILIDPSKGPELLKAVTNNPNELRQRIRGTGITPGPEGKDTPSETFNSFQVDYNVRFKTSATVSGMGPAHDAAYAIGLALAATRTQEVSGASVAEGLRKLAGGATKLELTPTNVLPAFKKLAAGEKITAIGTFGILDWDENGAVRGGTLEMWCIGGPDSKPAYGTSGLFYDLKSGTASGTYTQCL